MVNMHHHCSLFEGAAVASWESEEGVVEVKTQSQYLGTILNCCHTWEFCVGIMTLVDALWTPYLVNWQKSSTGFFKKSSDIA